MRDESQPGDDHSSGRSSDPEPSNTLLQEQVKRLYQLTVYGRWLFVSVLWLTVGSLSLWGLRYPISLMQEYFTWAALRYGLAFSRLPALGLALCIATTIATLLWQSRNLLWDLPARDRQRLEQRVLQIRQQGASHPLWKWVCEPKK